VSLQAFHVGVGFSREEGEGGPVVVFDDIADRRDGSVVSGFDLEVEANARKGFEGLREGGNSQTLAAERPAGTPIWAEVMARIEFANFSERQVGHGAVAIGHAVDLRVVQQDRNPVAGKLEVGFDDRGTVFEAACEGRKSVFGRDAGTAAMADHERGGDCKVRVAHAAYGTMRPAMTVLTRDAIFAEIDSGRLRVTPFSRDQVGAASIDLTLGDEIRVIDAGEAPIDVRNGADFRDHTRVRPLDEPYVLAPGSTIHGITRERITLPPDLCGFLEGRSRFARLGLMIHVTSAFVQPGVDNRQVLEMSNVSARPLRIHPGVRLCQIVLMRTEGESRYAGQFADQDAI
jgi:dCTP deaminase